MASWWKMSSWWNDKLVKKASLRGNVNWSDVNLLKMVNLMKKASLWGNVNWSNGNLLKMLIWWKMAIWWNVKLSKG
jgi:hypothetical protein